MRTLAVVDYGMGNLRSVSQAVLHDLSPPDRIGELLGLRVTLLNVSHAGVPMLTALLRYLLVLEQGHGSAPEEIFVSDRALQVLGVLCLTMFALGVYVAQSMTATRPWLAKWLEPGGSLQRNDMRVVLFRSPSRLPILLHATAAVLRQAWHIPRIEVVSATEVVCRPVVDQAALPRAWARWPDAT